MMQHQVIRSLETRLYINGVWTEPQGRGSFGVEDPSTGEILTAVADAGPEDGVAALDAAVRAQASWAATPPRFRGDIGMLGINTGVVSNPAAPSAESSNQDSGVKAASWASRNTWRRVTWVSPEQSDHAF